jgi:hypothetical protein
MPRRKASSNVTPRTCHRCVRLCQSICHCVAHPSSRSTQTNRPTKAISPPCWAATEANVEEVIVLSSTPLMLNFANAATLGNTIVIPRLPAASSSDSRCNSVWSASAVTMCFFRPCCISTKTPRTGRRESHGLRPSALRMSSIFFIKVDDQIVWSIAGALLVASWSARHLVVIAKCPDETFRLRFVCCQSTVARKLLRTGYFYENVLQARGEANDAVCLALARDDCLRSI